MKKQENLYFEVKIHMAFVCELCGCLKLVKCGDYFVCQKCNTKYSLEAARKLVNSNNSSGTQNSNSGRISSSRALQLARKAKDNRDYATSAKYYDLVLSRHPSHWEAKFYSVYMKAMNRPASETVTTAANLINNGVETLKLIKKYVSDYGERRNAIFEVSNKLIEISTMLITNATNHFNNINRQVRGLHRQSYLNNLVEAIKIGYIIGDQIVCIFGDCYIRDFALPCWKSSSFQHQTYLKHIKLILSVDVYNNYRNKIMQCENMR